MRQYADILGFDRNGQIALIAEVKNKRGTSIEWAAKLRRNMIAHGLLPDAPYFLLALPDRFYLWKNAGEALDVIEPTQKIDPQPFLQRYYEASGISPSELTAAGFNLVFASWLNQVLRARLAQDLEANNQEWLISSGLFDKLAGGHLELELAA